MQTVEFHRFFASMDTIARFPALRAVFFRSAARQRAIDQMNRIENIAKRQRAALANLPHIPFVDIDGPRPFFNRSGFAFDERIDDLTVTGMLIPVRAEEKQGGRQETV